MSIAHAPGLGLAVLVGWVGEIEEGWYEQRSRGVLLDLEAACGIGP